MRRVQIIGALCLAVAGCSLAAVSASAAPTDPFQWQYSFDGSGIPEGVENPEGIQVNHATGNILVYEHGVIDQYDANGNPVDFAALGSPTLPVGASGLTLTIDNTGGPLQGSMYLYSPGGNGGLGGERLWSYAADGSPFGGTTPHELYGLFGALPQAVRPLPSGNLRLFYTDFNTFTTATIVTDPTGQPIGPSEPFTSSTGEVANGINPPIFDELGNLYAGTYGGGELGKYDVNDSYKFLGETGLPAVPNANAIDPSTNDVYVRAGSSVLGIHYSDPLVKSTPFEVLGGLPGGGPLAFDATGQVLFVPEGSRISAYERGPDSAPFGVSIGIDGIDTDRATLHGGFRAGGKPASYHFEYGTTGAYGTSTPQTSAPFSNFPVMFGPLLIRNLQPDTTYHVRLVVTNSIGTTYGADRTFRTYPVATSGADTCPNVLARKQTLASRVPDCRAYELVSAADTAGYDVESYLAPGQSPLPGFPMANDKVLYAIHSGAVPGPWNPTNNGPDPYLATRTANGWATDYKGLPADINPAAGSFSSVLGEADSSLSTLAFAGPNLCSPCFKSGLETGIPVRLPSGQLAQGMSGSLAASVDPSARPEGKVAKYFSGDGKKLLFASKYAFEPGANDDNGSLTVYARNLVAGTTEIVSTDSSGNSLTGGGISELDVSADGSRVVVAKKVSEDPADNEYVHPYLHIAGRKGSIDLTPSTTSGVLYAGMSSDGGKVFFTSADKLVGSDTDESADLYEADVDGSGNLDLRTITNGNSDACNPVANSDGAHWNTTGASVDCSAVAISGGGGIAPRTGAAYFLSPEQFGGQGTLNQPNLYLAQPNGSIALVATLEPNDPLILDSVRANPTRRNGDFQTTPSGNYAVFASARELTGVDFFGFRNVFRYDAAGDRVDCASCDPSGTTDDSLAENVELAPNGLSLLEDGRVFFTTRSSLLITDPNRRKDVYEWNEGRAQLISSGSSRFNSALLSVSADGTDVFFFTNDVLAPEEDHNGQQLKIYDAREGGGFFKLPPSVPCQASDECHGPGTVTPPAPDIRSSGKTTAGNVVVCAKNRVKKRGKCVKRAHPRKKQAKKHAKKRITKTTGKRGGRHA